MSLKRKVDLTPIWTEKPLKNNSKPKQKTKEEPIVKEEIDLTPIWDKPPLKNKKLLKVIEINLENNKLDDSLSLLIGEPTPKETKNIEFNKYKYKVDLITESNKHLIDGIETRGWRTYHIDHKLSICWGFKNNIEPETIAHPDNLRMLWWKDNWGKNTTCFVDDKNSWIVGDKEIFTKKNQR